MARRIWRKLKKPKGEMSRFCTKSETRQHSTRNSLPFNNLDVYTFL